jgi:exopolysaccharide production protein ExoZ
MSYSYYLVHGFAVKAAMEIVARMVGPTAPELTFWLLISPVFALSLVPAACLFLAVEKPLSLKPGTTPGQSAVPA